MIKAEWTNADALDLQPTCNQLATDTISRQAAINGKIVIQRTNGVEIYSDEAVLVEYLKNLPSAQPEPKWIPVSEYAPYIDMSYPHSEHYLVQYDSGNMDVASWSNVNRFWTDHVTKPYWNCVQFAKVIAWMPLPEPYMKGDTT